MSKYHLENKILNIKLIIFDVDGVLTNGKKTYDRSGQKISKQFSDLDFTAIKIITSLGIPVVWLSGDDVVNKPLAKIKNIPFYFTRLPSGVIKDKIEFLPEILNHYSLTEKNIWFIGDDVFDLNLLKAIGLSSCPANASFLVRREVDLIHDSKSGDALASEVLELICKYQKLPAIDTDIIYTLQESENKSLNRDLPNT
jgi:YrbI family 3-deoxy-D-manno-octulosonate 8-phosphate phosphatase